MLHLLITVCGSDAQTMLCVEVILKLIKFEVFTVAEKKNYGLLGYDDSTSVIPCMLEESDVSIFP